MLTLAIVVYIFRHLRKPGMAVAAFRSLLKTAPLFLVLMCAAWDVQAQDKWELKKNSDGIRIYTRMVAGSEIKELKADFETKGSISRLAGLLLDVPGQKDWVYSTKMSTVVKVIDEQELIYYSEKSMPWPVTNRDVVMHVKLVQDPAKRTLVMNAWAENNVIPVKKNLVRVPSSQVAWRVTTTENNLLKIEYYAKADPGGTVPAWVTNMFLTKGPYETFLKLKNKLQGN